jgi:hypothetical protein
MIVHDLKKTKKQTQSFWSSQNGLTKPKHVVDHVLWARHAAQVIF